LIGIHPALEVVQGGDKLCLFEIGLFS
jgi:hypothetical protein